MVIGRCLCLSVLLVHLTCMTVLAEEAEVKSIRAEEIEEDAVQILGKSSLPLSTVFTGKLTIVEIPGKDPEVRITIPKLDRTISFDVDFVRCYALSAEDDDVRAYHGADIVAYEFVAYYGYPVDFWEDRTPLVSPSRKWSAGMRNMIMVRRAKLKPNSTLSTPPAP